MEVRQLKYFVATADTLNFSRAAESLFVSQSALSKQIADLEKELGVILLKRDKRTVKLTAAGKIFLNEAKEVLARMDTMPVLLEQESVNGPEELLVHIGVDERVGGLPVFHRGVAEAVQQLRRENPGLRAIFKVRDYQQINGELNAGRLDMGVFMGTREDVNTAMAYKVLYEDAMVLTYRGAACDQAGDDAVRQILSERALYLIDKEFRGMAQIVRILGAMGIEPSIRFCENMLDMSLMMESGEGCAIMPLSMARRLQNDKIRVVEIHRPEAKVAFLATWKKNNDNPLLERIALRASLNIEVIR